MREQHKVIDKKKASEPDDLHRDFSSPIIGAERAEEKIFEEAKNEDKVISDYRTKIGK